MVSVRVGRGFLVLAYSHLLLFIKIAAAFCLGFIDLTVDGVAGEQLFMGTKTVDAAFFKHKNAVSILNTGDALCDDQFRRVRDFFAESPADLCIRCGIHSTRTVIEDQDLRLFQQGTRDTKALLLTTGDVVSALFDMGVISLWERVDELICTCKPAGFPAFFVSCLQISPAQIVIDGTGEQYIVL